jgi:hypothetical protein
LEQIVAPIAMYPDRLIAQILTAATNLAEIVEADRWMRQRSSFDEAAFGEAVDQQPWDPNVKALRHIVLRCSRVGDRPHHN